MSSVPAGSLVRRATVDDIAVIAHHRAAMFREMGSLPVDLVPQMERESSAFLGPAITSGEYAGWLACLRDQGGTVAAGAGVQRRRVMPRPSHVGEPAVVPGHQGIIINVYTEPGSRRRGLAESLMRHIIDWARVERLDSLVLHAAPDGRHLYEKLGFTQTNEMRFNRPL